MFERVTIGQSITNPLRDSITDNDSGLTFVVVQMSKELFVPLVHLEAHESGFYIGFTDNPFDRYNGIYFLVDRVAEDPDLDWQDVFAAAFSYCKYRKLPEPMCVVPVNKMG